MGSARGLGILRAEIGGSRKFYYFFEDIHSKRLELAYSSDIKIFGISENRRIYIILPIRLELARIRSYERPRDLVCLFIALLLYCFCFFSICDYLSLFICGLLGGGGFVCHIIFFNVIVIYFLNL